MSTSARATFLDLNSDIYLQLLTEHAAEDLARRLADSRPGACLRVSTLPRTVMQTLAERLHREHLSAYIRLLIAEKETPRVPWEAKATQLVALRNAEDRPLLIFVPPGLHTSAEDSFDVSTFAEVNFSGLAQRLRRTLMAEQPEAVRDKMQAFLEQVERSELRPTDDQVVRYLLTFKQNGMTKGAEGLALYQLGLIPDRFVFSELDPDELSNRLKRNIQAVQTLADPSATLLTRVYRLKLDQNQENDPIQTRLYQFLNRRTPEDVVTWGRDIVTNPEYQSLTLDNWPFIQAQPDCWLYVQELNLPVRQDIEGAIRYLNLNKTAKLSVTWETSPDFKNINQLDHFRIEIVNTTGTVMYESGRIGVRKGSSRRMSSALSDIADIGLPEDVYFVRVRAYTVEGGILNREDRGDSSVLRNPDDPDGRRINESEEFLYTLESPDGNGDETPDVRNRTVASFLEARLEAQWKALDDSDGQTSVRSMKLEKAAWLTPPGSRVRLDTEIFNIRYNAQSSFTLKLSGLLTEIERRTLVGADALGRWRVHFMGDADLHTVEPEPRTTLREAGDVPAAFLEARRAVFNAIASTPEIAPEQSDSKQETQPDRRMVVATVSLLPMANDIEAYLEAYLEWLTHLQREWHSATTADERAQVERNISLALDVDSVQASVPRYLGDRIEVRLLGPTHPLRLWWHLQWQREADDWVDQAVRHDRPKDLLSETARSFLRSLMPYHIPHLLIDVSHAYIDNGPLTPFWQLYMPTHLHDSRATRARLERLLSTPASGSGDGKISSRELTRKIWQYLTQHPYVATLKLNVFNPGDGRLLAETLVELQDQRPDLRYEIHLFSEEIGLDEIGSALLELQNPNRQVSEAQDEFTQASSNHLFPKLRLARHKLSDLQDRPDRFTAHISLLLDLFPVEIEAYPAVAQGRSSYIHSLIQEPVTWFAGSDQELLWRSQHLPETTTSRDAVFAATLNSLSHLQALIRGGEHRELDYRPTVRLGLDLDAMGLMYQIHSISDWVLTVDNNLGLEYFDAAPQADRPIYLLDFAPQYLTRSDAQMALTTWCVDEILGIVGPALERYDIREGEGQEMLFLHSLRSLSGHLALKLLAAPNHADEAISLALSRLFLEQAGLMSNHIVIPLDAHTDLFSTSARVRLEPELSRRRSDLLMVEADPETRTLVFHLIEVKSRRLGFSWGLESEIEDQLGNTERVLRARFGSDQPLLDVGIRTKELMSWIGFYLSRAQRYGLVSTAAVDTLRPFLSTLDQGYSLQFVRTGLIFDLTADGLRHNVGMDDTVFYYIGANHISQLVQQGLRNLAEASSDAQPAEGELAEPLIASKSLEMDPTFSHLQQRLTTTSARVKQRKEEDGWPAAEDAAHSSHTPVADRLSAMASLPPDDLHATDRGTELLPQHAAPPASTPPRAEEAVIMEPSLPLPTDPDGSATSDRQRDIAESVQMPAPTPRAGERSEAPRADIWLGETHRTAQYGILGMGSGKLVALDLNGVNTISLFGVQGAGKSYTMGSIIEMATQSLPGLNHLPNPLAIVVFHYHESQDYPPEFVSMAQPNTREEEVQRLREEYGAEPAGLQHVTVLTSADKVALRKAEFPNIAVHPIYFRSSELGVRDWMFLMGAIGNQSMYINQVAKIMRDCRDNLTLDAIRMGVQNSRLSGVQKELAELRLDFAAEYINDQAPPLVDQLKPGSLVIIDLRDELIQKDQALGLFVVLLNIFANAGAHDSSPFNKLIVFDEAHKYMTGGELTDEVVKIIRQMRHQGVSVLIASQNPDSLPGAVIELSGMVILHRFNSPNWLKHIQKSVIALGDLTGAQLAALRPGEAYVWANRATEPIYSQKAVRIRLRPRATMHGGATRTAS